MADELLPQQGRIDAILAEVDLKRKELERRDHQIIEEAVQHLCALGLSDHRARQIVRAHGKFKVVVP
jgi:hypothetical protein